MHEIEREERAIYVIIAMALSPIVIGVLLRGGGEIDAGMTMSFGLVVLAVIGIVASIRAIRRDRIPRARARRV